MKGLWINLHHFGIKFVAEFSFFTLSRFCLKVFLVIFPFQISTIVFGMQDFFSGGNNVFLQFSIHAAEIFLILSCIFAGFSRYDNTIFKKSAFNFTIPTNYISLALLLFIIYSLIHSVLVSDNLSFVLSLRHLEFFGLYLLISNRVMSFQEILKYLSYGMMFQFFLACLQYLKQGSVGFFFLGEPQLGPDNFNTAKIALGDQKIIRPYGTLPHANVLGALFVFVISLYFLIRNNKNFKFFTFLLFFSIGLLLSFSRTAFLAMALILFIYFVCTKIKINVKYIGLFLSLMLFLVVTLNLQTPLLNRFMNIYDQAVTERIQYVDISISMLKDHWLFGQGLGQFTLHMQEYTSLKLAPWNYQPVHNVFLLIWTELGLPGIVLYLSIFLAALVLLLNVIKKDRLPFHKYEAKVLLALGGGMVILGFFDHYLFTLFPGLVLFYLYFGLINNILENPIPQTIDDSPSKSH